MRQVPTSPRFTDLAPLSALTSLTELYLRENQITDIAPLSALTSLEAGVPRGL
eukprot:SAG22_NODE_20195_length_267_cov_1.529762_1_plen_52_part_01